MHIVTMTFFAALILVQGARAASLDWTGAVNGAWDTSTANWTGEASVYTDGDNVTFTSGSNRIIALAATYAPVGIAFANALGTDFSFSGGGFSGSGALSKAGAGDTTFGETTSFTGYSGLIGVSGGRLLRGRTTTGSTALGSGTITLSNGGQLGINPGTGWGTAVTLTNPISAASSGGTLTIIVSFDEQNPTFSGPITLNGGTLSLQAVNAGSRTLKYFLGPLSLTASSAVTRLFSNSFPYSDKTDGYNGARPVIFQGTINGAGHTLTIDGVNMWVKSAASMTVGSLVVEKDLWVESRALAATLIVNLAAAGTVSVATNGLLVIGTGTLDAAKLSLGNGATLQSLNGNTSPTITNALSVASNRTVWIGVHGENDTRAGMDFQGGATFASGSRMVFGPGTLGRTDSLGKGHGFKGTARFLGGSTIEGIILRSAGTMVRGAHTIVFGDTDPGTAETITIKGRGAGVMAFADTAVTDVGGVTLRYEAATNTAPFKVGWGATGWGGSWPQGWLTRSLIGGSATTEFAPMTGTGENGTVILVGPRATDVPNTVFTASTSTTVISAGTVAFRHSVQQGGQQYGSWYAGGLGPVVVADGGSLTFTTNGIVLASNVTFQAGTTLSVTPVGTNAMDIGTIQAVGALAFGIGAVMNVSNPSGLRPTQGYWIVAEAAEIIGLPSVEGGFTASIEEGSPVRLKIVPLASGTVVTIR